MNAQYLNAWVLAARPKTLVAALAPVFFGAGLAFSEGKFIFFNLLVATFASICIQIGTNFANDYYDFIKGADTKDRLGPKRATQAGLISPENVRIGFVVCFCVATAAGLYLVYDSGFIIAIVGTASIVSGIAYTAGPWPLAYIGLGEAFVLIFFGPVASGFTYYVLAHEISWVAFAIGFCPGFLSCAILVANNLRDIVQDEKSNKRTLAVRFGSRFAQFEYSVFWIGSYSILTFFAIFSNHPQVLLPFLLLPIPISLCSKVFKFKQPQELIRVLERTAIALMLFTLLFLIGLLL